MPRNRIIYNLQDLFFGRPSGSHDNLIESSLISNTGDIVYRDSTFKEEIQYGGSGEFQVLRRIDRLQSINYSYNSQREEVNVLGRSTSAERPVLAPPDIGLNFSYLIQGIQNENRMGFNIAAQGSGQVPLFIKDFLDTSRLKDKRNIYLLINNKNEFDIRNYEKNSDLYSGFIFTNSYRSLFDSGEFGTGLLYGLSGSSYLVENTDSKNFGMLIFQNAYMQSYSLEASVGSLARADVAYAADNVIYRKSAYRDSIPHLDTVNGTTVFDDKTKYLVPRYWSERENDPYWNLTFGQGDIQVEISREDNPKKSQTIINYDFENSSSVSATLYEPAKFEFTGEAYSSASGFAIFGGSGLNSNSNYGGASFPLTPQIPGRRYSVSFWAKAIANSGLVSLNFLSPARGFRPERRNNLSFPVNTTSEWAFYSNTSYLNITAPLLHITTNVPNHTFVIDDLKVYEELDDITFHNEPLQTFKFSFDLPRDGISYLGHKLYFDRQPKLPIKVGINLSTLAQENNLASGSFLNNLALDSDYSFKVKFYDKAKSLRLFYDFHNAKLDSIDYSLDVGGNKNSTLGFSMQMDPDDDTQGIFVSGNFPELTANFIDESGNVVLDESNVPIGYNFFWKI